MQIEVGKPYNYGLYYGRVSSIEDDVVYFATPHGTRYKDTPHRFRLWSIEIPEDHPKLVEYEKIAMEEAVEFYGGFIPEYTRAALSSRYGRKYGILYDRKEDKVLWTSVEQLQVVRRLEAHNAALFAALEHIMSAVQSVADSGDFAIGEDAVSTLMSAYEDVMEANVGSEEVASALKGG